MSVARPCSVLLLVVTLLPAAVSTSAEPSAAPAPPARAAADPPFTRTALAPDRRKLKLRSGAALVVDRLDGSTLYAKGADEVLSIASITKLMTAMVILDAGLPPDEIITIEEQDKDRLKYSRSALPVGTRMTRDELLHAALVASENRAGAALARTFPGGRAAFVLSMNEKAAVLGMDQTEFVEPTGLDSRNRATARDLSKLVEAASGYARIRAITTLPSFVIQTTGKAQNRELRNTNLLVRRPRKQWEIGLSKTGYILEAGRCLVMQARVAGRPLSIVLLNAWGKYTSIGDANRIRKWLEASARGNGST